MAQSTKENIRLAVVEHLKANGYTVLGVYEPWGKYTTFPLCKVVFDGVSTPTLRGMTNKVIRTDTISVIIRPYNTVHDFFDVIGTETEKIDSLFIDVETVRNLMVNKKDKLADIKVGKCEPLFDQSTTENSVPYANVKIDIEVQYSN